jgi:hypothetical protein
MSFPGILRNIGTLLKLDVMECDPDMSVWVETSVPALLKAVATVLEPDPKEVYHQLSGKSLQCDLKLGIKQAIVQSGNPLGPADRFFFKLAEFFDVGLWRLFLISVGFDGLIDWASLAYEVQGCAGGGSQHRSNHPFGATSAPDRNDISNGFAWFTDNPIIPAIVASVTVEPGQAFALAWACQGHDFLGNPMALTAELYSPDDEAIYDRHVGLTDGLGAFHPTIVWLKGRNPDPNRRTYSIRAWGAPDNPQHECFPGEGTLYVRVYS